jgi:4-hydroxy-2-oxovalerate aldolase
MPTELEIMDVTIRDGSFLIDFSYTPEQIGQIVERLDDAGVSYIEASHGVGVGAKKLGYAHGADDLAYARAAAKARKRAKLGALADPRAASLDEISALSEYLDFLRIITNPAHPEPAKDYIERCKKEGLEVSVQLTRSYAVEPEVIAESAKKHYEWGADIVYLVDSTGCMMPGEVTRYVEAIRKVSDVKLGFHAHNTLQLALANTLEAIDAGCARVDASLLGVGKDAGNVSLEALVIVLQQQKRPCTVSLKKIIEAGEYIRPIFSSQTRPSWYTYYLASHRRDLFPLQLIDILAQELGKSAFEVIDTYASIPGIIEYSFDDLKELIRRLGGDPQEIFEKYQIKPTS